MDKAVLGSLVRALLQVVAGAVGFDAYADGETLTAISAAIVTIGTLGWSIYQKKAATKKLPPPSV